MKVKTQKLVMTGVMAALLAVLSPVSIPTPVGVPITLQTFLVALCGFVLGPGLGTAAVAVYLALGAVGLPVFAEFSSGAACFLGMTGGFLWGFLLMVFLCGIGARGEKPFAAIPLGIAGLAVCHLCGTVQFSLVTSNSLFQAFLLASAPYFLKDVVFVAAAYFASKAVKAALKKARLVAE